MLLLFCVCSIGYTFYLLTTTFSGKRLYFLPGTTLTKPPHFVSSGNNNCKDAAFMTLEEYQKIHPFKTYMDSLARSPPERKAHDSILLKRPGLMDSILYIENLYNSKNKK